MSCGHKPSDMYERKNALNKASRMGKLVRLKYEDGDHIVVHNNTFMGEPTSLNQDAFR